MKTRWIARLIVPLLLLSGCKKDPAFKGVRAKATEWTLHDTRVCGFFGRGPTTNPDVGCWENEDGGSYFNKDDRENDHLYLVDVDMPKEKSQRLSEGHNAVLHCIRDSYTHLACQ